MSAPISNGDILEIRIGSFTTTQVGINTVHFQAGAPTGTMDIDDVATYFDSILHTAYKAILAPGATYYGVGVQRIDPAPRTVMQYGTGNQGAGTFTGNLLPQQVSGIVSAYTENAGRKYRGRVFLPFPPEEASDPATNKPTGPYVALIQAVGDIIYSPFTVTFPKGVVTLDPCLWHRSTKTVSIVDAAYARSRWGTQRRRSSSGRSNTTVPF